MYPRLKPLAVLLPLLFVNYLHAQEELPTIVVTATRFGSNASDHPIAAQVITADEIRDSSATTVSEVLGKLGGVHTRLNFTGIPDSPLDLRGFGVTGDQNTLVLLNGQRISENESVSARLSAVPIDSIERIEILRGAGAVLYGGGATGGTINIITRSPVDDGLTGKVLALAGSHDLRDLRGGLQFKTGDWGLSLNAQRYENDNYRANNRAESQVVSGELRLGEREEFVALNFSADDQKSRLAGTRSEAQLSSDPGGTSTPNDFVNSRSDIVSLRGEKRFGEITLAVDMGQRNKTYKSFGTGTYDFFGVQTYTIESATKLDVTTLSPRLLWKSQVAGMNNRLTTGVDWSDWSYTNDGNNTDTGFGDSTTRERGKQTNRAFYFSDELDLTTRTRLSVGARDENVNQDQEERVTPIPKRAHDLHLSAHELALQQELGSGYSAYGRIGQSFRISNIDENRCYAFVACNPLLKPQRSSDHELGLQWQGNGASWRAGLYEFDITDEIYFNRLVGGQGTNVNLSPTHRRGLELEGKLPLASTVDLAARYTRTQARFREGVYGGIDVTGNDVPLVPEDRIGLNLGWQATDTTRLTFNANYVGSQRYDNDQANLFRSMPSYTVADVKINHDIGAWRLAVGINNLFDKDYYSYGVTNASYSSFNAYPEDRRSAYISAEYRF
jgi:iron complex outermembrane receptor protein